MNVCVCVCVCVCMCVCVCVHALSVSPTLWGPMDYSPPSSSAHGVFRTRILEWVAISYAKGMFQQFEGSKSEVGWLVPAPSSLGSQLAYRCYETSRASSHQGADASACIKMLWDIRAMMCHPAGLWLLPEAETVLFSTNISFCEKYWKRKFRLTRKIQHYLFLWGVNLNWVWTIRKFS